MQNCTTILGIIDMRQRGISYDDCRSRYHIGCSTISLIMSRFYACGKDLNSLKQMSAEEVEHLFFPPENLRRKDDSVMLDYQMVYDRLTAPGSKANLFYLWLKYKKECPSGYQYTQYCLHFKRFVEKNYGSEAVSMVVERIPGEKVYIDWIGDQPEILMDSITGELKKVHFFVTTVGVSNLVYAEAFEDEKLPNFIAGTVRVIIVIGAAVLLPSGGSVSSYAGKQAHGTDESGHGCCCQSFCVLHTILLFRTIHDCGVPLAPAILRYFDYSIALSENGNIFLTTNKPFCNRFSHTGT